MIRQVITMFLWHFLLIKRNCVIFHLHSFLSDTDQNATISFSTDWRLTQFSYTEISNHAEDFTPLNDALFWHTTIDNFHDIFIFLNECHNFYTQIGKFTGDFVLNKICSFYQVDILHFPGTLPKMDHDYWRRTLSLLRNNKSLKITKNRLMQKFWWWWRAMHYRTTSLNLPRPNHSKQ